jgi:ribonuclease-3
VDLVHRRPLEPHRGDLLSQQKLPPVTTGFLATLTGAPPQRQELWVEALTHGSMGEPRDYQRLEFLGDRVLGMVIAETLFAAGPGSEGELSQRLNALVSREACADVARGCGVADHIRLGKQARDDGGRDSDNILGDVTEALIAALFLERGYEAARGFVTGLWESKLAGGEGQRKHPKAALQEWAAGSRHKLPEYHVVDRQGPDHAVQFTVAVSIKGVGEVQATAGSKQEAETTAAAEFMRRFG